MAAGYVGMEVSAAAVVLLKLGMSELVESELVELSEREGMLESEVVVASSVVVDVAAVVVAEVVASVDVALVLVSVLSEVVAEVVVDAVVVSS